MKKKILAAFLLACALALSAAPAAWAATVNYAVTGGNIQFDTETGTITGCDKTVTAAEIPTEIENVSVQSIGSRAFYNCIELKSVTIPDSVTSIGDLAFWYCGSLTSVNISDSVTSIGAGAFNSCKSLTSIEIPTSVTSIGNSAFYNCTGLTSITIPDSVTSIGTGAFNSCKSLTEIIVDSGNSTYMSDNGVLFDKDKTTLIAYPASKETTSFAIPDSVTSIGTYAFHNCSSLTSIDIPTSITSIGNSAFYNCSSLTSITIPVSVTSIGTGTFIGCPSLTEIIVDSGNSAYISDNGVLFNKDKTILIAYPANKEDTSFAIPDTVTSIGAEAFIVCRNLTNINIPDSVTSIGEGAFSYCRSLTGITVSSDNSKYISENGVLFNEDKTILIAYPANKEDTSFAIPNSVTNIGTYAFSGGSNLTSLTIPASVTSIESTAFYGCNNLTDVYYTGSEAEWSNIDIQSNNAPLINATIHYNSTAPEEPANVSVTGVSLNEITLNLQVNGTATLQATVAPTNATNKSVRWSSNNTSVATVDANGKVTAVTPGNATITVTTEDGNKTATCAVTVVEKKIPVTAIALDKTELTLEVKTIAQLKATVEPTDTTSTISWTSSDEKVAIVDSTGKVTPLTKGTATITAEADGVKATCEVTVTADTVYTITFDTDGGTLAEGVTNPDYVTKGKEYKMPTASKSRYTLTAWAIGAKDSKNKVKANEVYTFTADTTVYAI